MKFPFENTIPKKVGLAPENGVWEKFRNKNKFLDKKNICTSAQKN